MKKYQLVGLSLLIAIALAGCSGTEGKTSESSSTAQEDQADGNSGQEGQPDGASGQDGNPEQESQPEEEDPMAGYTKAEVYGLVFYYDDLIQASQEEDGMLFQYAGESAQPPLVRVYKDTENDSAKLADGLLLQSGQEDAFADVAIIGQGIQAGLVFYEEEIDSVYWAVQFFLIEDKDGTIVIEYRLPQNGDTEMIQAMEEFLDRTAKDVK